MSARLLPVCLLPCPGSVITTHRTLAADYGGQGHQAGRPQGRRGGRRCFSAGLRCAAGGLHGRQAASRTFYQCRADILSAKHLPDAQYTPCAAACRHRCA